MLGSDATAASGSPLHPGEDAIREAYRSFVLPCGAPAVNRLEELLERKFALVRSLFEGPADAARASAVLDTVLSTRPYRGRLLESNPPERFAEVARRAARGIAPKEIAPLARSLEGAPVPVLQDLAAEIAHGAAPDRLGLLSRWVWNSERRTGILGLLVPPGPETVEGAQALLGEMRLQLAALGFPSRTFASVDILLALAYASHVARTTDRSFQGGGIESLLPGPYGLASLVLGVRRWVIHADR